MEYYFCDLSIDKTEGFSNTAMLLGTALGVSFHKDEKFLFDEVLAYIAETETLRFILYSIPDDEASFYDDINYYHLEVRGKNRLHSEVGANISSEIKRKIEDNGRLRCEIMKSPED